MPPSEQQVYVFNQYYIDFLKKIKGFAKEQKETKKEARDILRAIKKHYASMDKMSMEYVTYLENTGFWETYRGLEDKTSFTPEFQQCAFYQDIRVEQLVSVVPTPFLLHHYLCLMDIFVFEDVPVEPTIEAIKVVHNPTEFALKLEPLQDKEELVKRLQALQVLHQSQAKSSIDKDLKEIEGTSLGKLAKEIMGEVNIEELQKTIMEPNTDILGSLQNPDSPFGKILGNVSQKMISKLASGEINQENLLQDAIQLATKLPGMIPGGGGGGFGNLAGLGKMFQQFQGMAGGMGGGDGDGEGFDIASLMKGMGLGGAQKKTVAGRLHSAQRREKTKERLRKKLEHNQEK